MNRLAVSDAADLGSISIDLRQELVLVFSCCNYRRASPP